MLQGQINAAHLNIKPMISKACNSSICPFASYDMRSPKEFKDHSEPNMLRVVSEYIPYCYSMDRKYNVP